MRLFHQHEWVEVARTYAPPQLLGDMDLKGNVEAVVMLIERMKFGVTNILWRCTSCDAFRKDQLAGKLPAEDR